MTYGDLIADSFRYLGINDLVKLKRMKINEYRAMINGYKDKYIDEMERLHLLAWQTNSAGQFKANGSPVYASFSKFFDRKDWASDKGKKLINHESIAKWDQSIKNAEELLNRRFSVYDN